MYENYKKKKEKKYNCIKDIYPTVETKSNPPIRHSWSGSEKIIVIHLMKGIRERESFITWSSQHNDQQRSTLNPPLQKTKPNYPINGPTSQKLIYLECFK